MVKRYSGILRATTVKSILFLLLAAVLFTTAVFVSGQDSITAAFQSPAEVKNIQDIQKGRFITITTEQIYQTGWEYTRYNVSKAHYGLIRFEDAYLLIKFNLDEDLFNQRDITVTVYVREADGYDRQIAEELQSEREIKIYNFVLDKYANTRETMLIQTIVIICTAFILLIILVTRLIRIIFYKRNEGYTHLADLGDPAVIENSIDLELKNDLWYRYKKSLWITRDYMIIKEKNRVRTFLQRDLIWVVWEGTGRKYTLKFYFMDKTDAEIKIGSDIELKEAVDTFSRLFPKIHIGYSDTLFNLYNNYFNEFVRSAKER